MKNETLREMMLTRMNGDIQRSSDYWYRKYMEEKNKNSQKPAEISTLLHDLSMARGEASVWRQQVDFNQAELQIVWRMNDALKKDIEKLTVEVDELKAQLGDLPEAQADMLSEIKRLKAKLVVAEADNECPACGYVRLPPTYSVG